MVNFMCHLGWTMISRYLVKHYSDYFCESAFGGDLHLISWILSKADHTP